MNREEKIIYRINNKNNKLFRDSNDEYKKLNNETRNMTPGWKKHVSEYESTFLEFYVQSSLSPLSYIQFHNYLIERNENYLFGFNGKDSLFYSLGMDDNHHAKYLYREQFKQLLDASILKVDIYIGKVLAFTENEVMFDITKVEHYETLTSYEKLVSI